jgi:hypothetical protein
MNKNINLNDLGVLGSTTEAAAPRAAPTVPWVKYAQKEAHGDALRKLRVYRLLLQLHCIASLAKQFEKSVRHNH